MVSSVIGEQIQIIAVITVKQLTTAYFNLTFQLKSNLINKRTLIVSDCSPFEARDERE
jgi:hypothetical protein